MVRKVWFLKTALKIDRTVSAVRNSEKGDVTNLVNTLKTNVIGWKLLSSSLLFLLWCLAVGLGNYINTINREVNNLATKTRESVENVNQQVVELTAEMKSIEDDVLDLKLNKNVASDRTSEDFIASSLRTDVAGRFYITRQIVTLS